TGTITTATSFSASPAGLTIDPVTGEITPGTSTQGTYTVTYTIADDASCGIITTTTTVDIWESPTVANAGPDQAVCTTATTLAGNTPTVGTGQWTVVSGAGTFANVSSPTSGITG